VYTRRALVGLATALLVPACHRGKNEGARAEVQLGVAVSLRGVMPSLIEAFGRDHRRPKIAAVYGPSGDLRKRVQDGAPLDAVLFAAPEPVDQLVASRHVIAETRKVVAHNRLVLIGPRGGARVGWQTLDALPAGEKLAIGEPNVVPAGTYAKRALEALGKWDALKDRLLFGGDVAAVLAYVRRGEVAAGIVYATEVRGLDDIVLLEEASGPWAPRADVVVGATVDIAGASHSGPARSFLEFLLTPEAQGIFRQYGFETDG